MNFQVDLAVEDIQQKEEHDIMLVKCRGSSLRTMSPLEQQGHGVLTQFALQEVPRGICKINSILNCARKW